MGSTPLVSILIPNYNKAPYLQETLNSVLTQTSSNWECIVVDDQSTDDSWEILGKFAGRDTRFRVYKRLDSLHKGGNVCRNLALEKAHGDLVLFLDSDDVLAPYCLENRLESIQQHFTSDFWAFPTALFEKHPSDSGFLWNKDDALESDLSRFLRMDALWQTSGCIYKKEFLTGLNGLSPNRRFWQDYELHLKALLTSHSYQKYFELPPDVFIRNGDPSSLSRSTPFSADLGVLQERIHFLEEIFDFAYIRARKLDEKEIHSLFSFQYHLILQLWLKHGEFRLFREKWNVYSRQYGLSSFHQLKGLYQAAVLKINNRLRIKLKNAVSGSTDFPDYSILNGVQIGRHPVHLEPSIS